MKTLLMIAALAAVSGCATMIDEHRRIADWPEVEVRDNVVSFAEVIRRCSKYTSPLSWPPLACAEIHFDTKVCNIWRMEGADSYVMEHEAAHCNGYQHPGDDTLAQAWKAYQQHAAGAAVARGLNTTISINGGRK